MTVRLTFHRPEFADGRASVWSADTPSAGAATVNLDEQGQGYIQVRPDAAHDVVLRSAGRPPEAARVQMPSTNADFDEVRLRPDGSLRQDRSDDDARTPFGNLAEIRDELRLTRKAIAAHGLATAGHQSDASLITSVRSLNRMMQDNP